MSIFSLHCTTLLVSTTVPVNHASPAKSLTAKFKNLRRVLNAWKATISNLAETISGTKLIVSASFVLQTIRGIQPILRHSRGIQRLGYSWMEFQGSSTAAFAFLVASAEKLLEAKSDIKWIKFGDGNTKLFHANATIKFWKNTIISLTYVNGNPCFDHETKSNLI